MEEELLFWVWNSAGVRKKQKRPENKPSYLEKKTTPPPSQCARMRCWISLHISGAQSTAQDL
ncbi:hypothetical protein CHS0354_002808, partial [Potamilus streckersoni]